MAKMRIKFRKIKYDRISEEEKFIINIFEELKIDNSEKILSDINI